MFKSKLSVAWVIPNLVNCLFKLECNLFYKNWLTNQGLKLILNFLSYQIC